MNAARMPLRIFGRTMRKKVPGAGRPEDHRGFLHVGAQIAQGSGGHHAHGVGHHQDGMREDQGGRQPGSPSGIDEHGAAARGQR